jgi:guanylate kinase
MKPHHLGGPQNYPGSLMMIVAPSGAGKSSLIHELLERDASIQLSVSYTTRPPRPTEQEGREYHFVSVEDFSARRQMGEFLEWAEVHGHLYATSLAWMAEQMQASRDVLVEIDWQGAQQIRKFFNNAVEIFILPPSLQALEERLKRRAQDTTDTIARRLLMAGREMAHATEADYIVINEQFAQALEQLQAIVCALRLRTAGQCAKHQNLFARLGVQPACL